MTLQNAFLWAYYGHRKVLVKSRYYRR